MAHDRKDVKPPLKFLKIGGSLISDKSVRRSLREDALDLVCASVASALRKGGFSLLIAHGGGSFGHTVARDYRVAEGLMGGGGWQGFHLTRDEMVDFNRAVCSALRRAGVNAAGVQPSSFCAAGNGAAVSPGVAAIRALLDAGAVPVIFGDAVADPKNGFTILSTEKLFIALAPLLEPAAIIELSDVPGVLSDIESGSVITRFSRADLKSFKNGGVRGADVTGGMGSKAELLVELAERNPCAEVRLVCGLDPASVESAMLGNGGGGTLFTANAR